MNLGTMKTALARIAGVDLTDPLTDWINAALHEFEDAYPWPFLENTYGGSFTPGTYALTVPTDFFRIETLRFTLANTSYIIPKYKPWIQVNEENWKHSDANVRGKPQWYTLIGQNFIVVYPAADLTYGYAMSYTMMIPDLAGDADIPAIPAKYHYTVVKGAVVYALEGESEGEAAIARTVFEDSIDRHITRIGGKRQEGSYGTTRDVMEYGT